MKKGIFGSARLKTALIASSATLALSAGTFFAVSALAAGIPEIAPLTYTGYLETPDGTPLTKEAKVSLEVWNAATDGKSVCASKTATVTPVNGRFQVALPNECTKEVAANPDLWLAVTVDGTSLGRTKLGAVPFAVEAGHALSASTADEAAGTLATKLTAM